MSELSPLSTGQVSRTGRVVPAGVNRPDATEASAVPGRGRGQDRVEFSADIRHLVELRNGGPVRTDLVNRIRAEIDQGSYETPEKLEAAIDELLGELNDE